MSPSTTSTSSKSSAPPINIPTTSSTESHSSRMNGAMESLFSLHSNNHNHNDDSSSRSTTKSYRSPRTSARKTISFSNHMPHQSSGTSGSMYKNSGAIFQSEISTYSTSEVHNNHHNNDYVNEHAYKEASSSSSRRSNKNNHIGILKRPSFLAGSSGSSSSKRRKSKTMLHHHQSWRSMSFDNNSKKELLQAQHKSVFSQLDCWTICKSRWAIYVVSIFVLAVLVATSVSIALVVCQTQEEELQDDAIALAEATGRWFSDRLDRAILPLFTLAQFATTIPDFAVLSQHIGPAGWPGSAGFVPNPPGQEAAVRDVAHLCQEHPTVDARFEEIAASIKTNAGMPGVLVTLELLPQGVICLVYPKNNTQDFEDGLFLDNTGALGLDLMTDPRLRYQGGQTVQSDGLIVNGPVTLRQCSNCPPAVARAFIARLPVAAVGNERMVFEDVEYQVWGFAVAIISWDGLLHRQGNATIFDDFGKHGLEYHLTRTDTIFSLAENDYTSQVISLAKSDGFDSKEGKYKSVVTTLPTVNEEWEMTILYDPKAAAPWKPWVFPVCVVASLAISFLTYLILLQRSRTSEMEQLALLQSAQVETERDMTAFFAHELRNPLGAIDSALQSMPDGLPAAAQDLIAAMKLCTDFMSTIMNNLLDARKFEEGKMKLHQRPVDLESMMDAVHKMLLPAVKPGVDFVCAVNLPPEKSWVLGDKQRIQQVMTNVITNAIKYTTTGSITISLQWAVGDDSYLIFECQDTGPGIPKSEQEELFQKFVKRGGAPGTGLGLSISKHIVDLVGGSIRFESDPSVQPGTTCIVHLPLPVCTALERQRALEHLQKVSEISTTPLHHALSILIVDDITLNRTMLKRRFVKSIAPNCSVLEASTGEEAVEIVGANTNTFDVIIMDMYMEEAGGTMTGTQTVVELRKLGVAAVIIGCSGNNLSEQFLTAGADVVWQKPLPTNPKMIYQMRKFLTKRGLIPIEDEGNNDNGEDEDDWRQEDEEAAPEQRI